MIEMSVQTRTYFVLGVMFACFAILYPKIFHPMLLSAMGWNRPVNNNNEYLTHPRDRMVHRPGNGPGPGGPGRPHPGMRMGEGTSSRSTGGGRGGIMSMVLPVYAIGIVLYLIYTLVKVFGGGGNSNEKNKERKEAILREYYRNFHYDADKGKFRLGRGSDDEDQSDEESDMQRWRRNGAGGKEKPARPAAGANRNLPHDLERLLRKVDDKNITEPEMRELRDRLEETERQMTRILEAMKEVQSRVDPSTDVEEKCQCSVDESLSDQVDDKLKDEVVENLTTPQAPSDRQEVRHRKHKHHEPKKSQNDSTESEEEEEEEEEFMDLDDGYEAEADEKDDDYFSRSHNMTKGKSEDKKSES